MGIDRLNKQEKEILFNSQFHLLTMVKKYLTANVTRVTKEQNRKTIIEMIDKQRRNLIKLDG